MNKQRRTAFLAMVMVGCCWLLGSQVVQAQTTVSGTVGDKNGPLSGVKISVKGTILGTISKSQGAFTVKTSLNPPFKLTFSFVGYKTKEFDVNNATMSDVKIDLEEQVVRGQEVVVGASRVAENIMQSPVSIEKMDIKAIQTAPTPDFYDAVANVKGVQTYTGSLTFQTFNTRGFATIANTRFVQLLDGMETVDPLLNFPTGNLVGLGELDAESVELVPGAASALYGPNAFNGILMMSSKNPFDYQGLSAQVKSGFTNSQSAGTNPYNSFALRYATTIGDNLAFKVNVNYLTATDWQGNDYETHRIASGNPALRTEAHSARTNFDGVNLYGDETAIIAPLAAIFTPPFAQFSPMFAPLAAKILALDRQIGGLNLKRTGMKEQDLIGSFSDGFEAKSMKADAALHYRINNDMEASLTYRFGNGSTIYQGAEKYLLRGFSEQFMKAELKGSNFFLRGYMTISDDGDSYNLSALGAFVNERFSPSSARWFPTYLLTFLGTVAPQLASTNNALPDEEIKKAHAAARAAADRGIPYPGSSAANQTAFAATVDSVRQALFQRNPPGAGFINDSKMLHIEGNYNFKDLIDVVEILVGGNYRQYDLFSNGTVFNEPLATSSDLNSRQRITIGEYGMYAQFTKRLMDDKLKIVGSVRYDKNANFDGQITPRLAAVYTIDNDHNVRASFQTGFRNPDTQAAFIWFPSGAGILLGSTEKNAAQYGVHKGGAYTATSVAAFRAAGGTLAANGTVGGAAAAASLLQTANLDYIKPERLQVIEVGYKGVIANSLFLDANFYYNSYKDFIGAQTVVSKLPTTRAASATATNPTGLIPAGTNFRPYTNSPDNITSSGFGLGFSYKIAGGYDLDGSYSYNTFTAPASEFESLFNTPENRFNIGISNRELVGNLGFGVNYRYSQEYKWESAFGTGQIPSISVIDAQLNYKIKEWKTMIKFGANNLFGKDYRTNYGAGFVGQLYYISLTFDEFMN